MDGTENHTSEYNLGVVGVDDIYSVSSVAKKIENNLVALNDERDWKVNDLKSDSLDMINTTMVTLETVFLMFGLIALILSIILMWNIFNIIKNGVALAQENYGVNKFLGNDIYYEIVQPKE